MHSVRAVILAVLLFAHLGVYAISDAVIGGATLEGDLRVTYVGDSTPTNAGRIQVERYTSGLHRRQVFGLTPSKGTRLVAGADSYAFGYYTGTQSRTLTSLTVTGGNTITASWTAGNLNYTHTVTYNSGDAFVSMRWDITNTGAPISDLRLFHGQDTVFSVDEGAGFYDAANTAVGVQRVTGMTMERQVLQGRTPPFAYESRSFGLVRTAVNAGSLGNLLDTISTTDNGYAMEWRRATLNSGEVWTIEAAEKFTIVPIGAVDVLATATASTFEGSSVDLTYAVNNPDSANSVTVTALTASSELAGWTASVISPATPFIVNAASSQAVVVRVTPPLGTGAATSDITLQATANSTNGSDFCGVTSIPVTPSTPTDSNAAANSVAESTANGSTVGVTASSSIGAYSLTDNAGGRFAIDSVTGIVTVANGALLDFEVATSHSITVLVTNVGLTASQTFTIAVTNVNETPPTPVDANGGTNSVAENATVGALVGVTAQSVDPDGTTIFYSLTDNAGGRFVINSSTGVVSVASGTLLNFEAAASHTITVQASDGTLTASQNFTIAVMNVNEAPVITSATAPDGVKVLRPVVFTVAASDPDGTTPTLEFDYGDGTSGTSTTHSYGSAGTFTVTVTASDGELTDQKTVTVTVSAADANDDLDGDGVPDELELALGTDPFDAGDSPVDLSNPIPIRREPLKATLSSTIGDSIEFRGVLFVPAGLDPVGESLVIYVAGEALEFELDEKRRVLEGDFSFQLLAKLNAKKAKDAKFKMKIGGELLKNIVKKSPKDEQGRPTQLSAHILFNGSILIQTIQLSYRK